MHFSGNAHAFGIRGQPDFVFAFPFKQCAAFGYPLEFVGSAAAVVTCGPGECDCSQGEHKERGNVHQQVTGRNILDSRTLQVHHGRDAHKEDQRCCRAQGKEDLAPTAGSICGDCVNRDGNCQQCGMWVSACQGVTETCRCHCPAGDQRECAAEGECGAHCTQEHHVDDAAHIVFIEPKAERDEHQGNGEEQRVNDPFMGREKLRCPHVPRFCHDSKSRKPQGGLSSSRGMSSVLWSQASSDGLAKCCSGPHARFPDR